MLTLKIRLSIILLAKNGLIQDSKELIQDAQALARPQAGPENKEEVHYFLEEMASGRARYINKKWIG